MCRLTQLALVYRHFERVLFVSSKGGDGEQANEDAILKELSKERDRVMGGREMLPPNDDGGERQDKDIWRELAQRAGFDKVSIMFKGYLHFSPRFLRLPRVL